MISDYDIEEKMNKYDFEYDSDYDEFRMYFSDGSYYVVYKELNGYWSLFFCDKEDYLYKINEISDDNVEELLKPLFRDLKLNKIL